LNAGADCVTLGNHAFDQREALVFIERQPRLLRPANYPPGTPGRGAYLYEGINGHRVLVMNVMGRSFMDPMDDPFAAVDRELAACPLGSGCDAFILDHHAETTSEKQAMGHHCDGRASVVVGTHTHIPTADHQILPGGTGYLTDAGMTGDYDSVIGMEKEEPLRRFIQKTPGSRFEPASGPATLCGLAVAIGAGGLPTRISPVRIGGRLEETRPDWW
jgi:metallophosphoesterase (TIGR00282 family)